MNAKARRETPRSKTGAKPIRTPFRWATSIIDGPFPASVPRSRSRVAVVVFLAGARSSFASRDYRKEVERPSYFVSKRAFFRGKKGTFK